MNTASENRRLIERSVTEWNQWRIKSPEMEPNLERVEFTFPIGGADLSNCYLADTRFIGTQVDGVDFSKAVLDRAAFVRVDLRRSLGLESARCAGWLSFDIWTLEHSCGYIPERLLTLAGVPDEQLERYSGPRRYHLCFVSYSSEDKTFAGALKARLEEHGVNVWFAPQSMTPGDTIGASLMDAAKLAGRLIVVLSKDSIKSRWVSIEVNTALTAEKPDGTTRIVPVSLDDAYRQVQDVGWVVELQSRHVLDFRGWETTSVLEKGVAKLLEKLTILPCGA